MKPCNSSSRTETPKIILSMVESKQLIETLKPHFDLVEAGGAGHKILCVVLGLADIYVTSKPSTFKWDTCAVSFHKSTICCNVIVFNTKLYKGFSFKKLNDVLVFVICAKS